MRFFSTVAILVAGASAMPTSSAPPAKFAIQITAPLNGGTTLFLKKGANGDGTKVKEEAAVCSLQDDKLICDGLKIGAQANMGLPNSMMDMAPFQAVKAGIQDGFSIDANNVLHFKSGQFKELPEKAKIDKEQGGEAEFGLFDLATAGFLGGGATGVKLYIQLGCPMGTHDGLHGKLVVGTNKIVPL